MKRLLYTFALLIPILTNAQNLWLKSTSDYMWMDVGMAGFSSAEAGCMCIAINPLNNQPYVAYNDFGNSSKATVMKFDGTNWVNVGNAGFSAGQSGAMSLAFSPSGQPYVAYQDGGNSSKATVMKFDGINWVNVGNAGFSSGIVNWPSLAFNPADNQPYVSFMDFGYDEKVTVMKFDGTNWVYVGLAGFSAGAGAWTSLAFSPSAEPFVAFAGGVNRPEVNVMKFDGTNWMNVGTALDSTVGTMYNSLAFSPSGQPYVAYQTLGMLTLATVKKFDGTHWVDIGIGGLSGHFMCLAKCFAFSPVDSLPYISLRNSYQNATVMKFDGYNWVSVGNDGFSAGTVDYLSLAFNSSGEPYVAYQDWSNNKKATVMKYDSIAVGIPALSRTQLSIQPNPATDFITIHLSGADLGSNLFVVNIEGQTLLSQPVLQQKTVIDVRQLPTGVYFVRMMCEGTMISGKFVKQ